MKIICGKTRSSTLVVTKGPCHEAERCQSQNPTHKTSRSLNGEQRGWGLGLEKNLLAGESTRILSGGLRSPVSGLQD